MPFGLCNTPTMFQRLMKRGIWEFIHGDCLMISVIKFYLTFEGLCYYYPYLHYHNYFTDSSSSSSSSSSSGKQSTSTVVTQAVSVAKTSTTASNTQTTVIEKEDSGNIFSRIRDGYVYSIVLVAGLALAFIILLALLAWCIYYFGCRRRGSNR